MLDTDRMTEKEAQFLAIGEGRGLKEPTTAMEINQTHGCRDAGGVLREPLCTLKFQENQARSGPSRNSGH